MFAFLVRFMSFPLILAVYVIAAVVVTILTAFYYLFVGEGYAYLSFPTIR
jgi:hypothetical protein